MNDLPRTVRNIRSKLYRHYRNKAGDFSRPAFLCAAKKLKTHNKFLVSSEKILFIFEAAQDMI
jgi:hypothetical protein